MNQTGFIIGRVVTAGLLLILFVFGLFYSRQASRSEALYPLRVLGEAIEYALIPSEAGKVNFKIGRLHDSLLDSRLELYRGKLDKVLDDSAQFADESRSIKNTIANLNQTGQDTSGEALGLKAATAGQLCLLEEAKAGASEDQRQAIQEHINAITAIFESES